MGWRVLLAGDYTVRMSEDARRGRARRCAFPNMLPAGRKQMTDSKGVANVGAHEGSRAAEMEFSPLSSAVQVNRTKMSTQRGAADYSAPFGGSMMMIWRSMTFVPVGPVMNSPSMALKKL
jgi:hypothetical protein